MKILGIDYGTKRLGLAVSDEDAFLASPLPLIRRSRSLNRDLMAIRTLAREHDISLIVVGLPLHMNGTRGEMAERAKSFASELQKHAKLPVTCFDERGTTLEAEGMLIEAGFSRKRRKDLKDSVAAAAMLQAYLDDRRPSESRSP